jgi:hypothetical protein
MCCGTCPTDLLPAHLSGSAGLPAQEYPVIKRSEQAHSLDHNQTYQANQINQILKCRRHVGMLFLFETASGLHMVKTMVLDIDHLFRGCLYA